MSRDTCSKARAAPRCMRVLSPSLSPSPTPPSPEPQHVAIPSHEIPSSASTSVRLTQREKKHKGKEMASESPRTPPAMTHEQLDSSAPATTPAPKYMQDQEREAHIPPPRVCSTIPKLPEEAHSLLRTFFYTTSPRPTSTQCAVLAWAVSRIIARASSSSSTRSGASATKPSIPEVRALTAPNPTLVGSTTPSTTNTERTGAAASAEACGAFTASDVRQYFAQKRKSLRQRGVALPPCANTRAGVSRRGSASENESESASDEGEALDAPRRALPQMHLATTGPPSPARTTPSTPNPQSDPHAHAALSQSARASAHLHDLAECLAQALASARATLAQPEDSVARPKTFAALGEWLALEGRVLEVGALDAVWR